ncbi:MAG: putative DNA binding domain-containing protein [Magnetococcales bacterium]|nr:putative DNA binding domain-containing protein [Magnetococcales bacterium]
MNEQKLQHYLQERFPKENSACEWKEFKNLRHAVTGDKGNDIISHVSAIANMEGGGLVIGVADSNLEIVGIHEFHDYTPENLRQRLLGRCSNLSSEGLLVEPFRTDDTEKTVWIVHIPKHLPRLPVYAHDKAWQRLDDVLVEMRHERLQSILAEPIESIDWSAQTVPGATIDDLDPDALIVARKKFKERNNNKPFYDEIDDWDTQLFLDRSRMSVNGLMTRTALLLLGQPAASYFLSPHPAQITWKLATEEHAYEHFGPPFLLTTTQVLHHIRNIKHKLFPNNQLLATEVVKYDTRVILEALHNCIAHQDYTRQERVLVTEKTDRLIFENAGPFFEGTAEDYLSGRKTPSRYRNSWLSQVMSQLGMIDIIGYGIYSMTLSQRKRFFPLPDYSKSTSDKVILEIFGHVIDESYSLLLLERQDLSIDTVILLDRVQKNLPITDEGAAYLRQHKLIEGRRPNYHVSAQIAASTGMQTSYIRSRGLTKTAQKQFVLDHLTEFGSASRAKLDNLLVDMLPAGLTTQQKRNKVINLLMEMRIKDQSIICEGRGLAARWQIARNN